MSDVIFYTRPEDGGLSICVPTGEVPIEVVLAKDVPANAIDPKVVPRANVPADRYFRNAWKQAGDRVDVDMQKARVIQMDKIRLARDEKLKGLDIEWMKAVAKKKNAEADAIEAERERLRQIPQSFDLSPAKNADELKVLWPEGL